MYDAVLFSAVREIHRGFKKLTRHRYWYMYRGKHTITQEEAVRRLSLLLSKDDLDKLLTALSKRTSIAVTGGSKGHTSDVLRLVVAATDPIMTLSVADNLGKLKLAKFLPTRNILSFDGVVPPRDELVYSETGEVVGSIHRDYFGEVTHVINDLRISDGGKFFSALLKFRPVFFSLKKTKESIKRTLISMYGDLMKYPMEFTNILVVDCQKCEDTGLLRCAVVEEVL